MMGAIDREVLDAVWETVRALLPPAPDPADHPLGCHRRRVPDEVCFRGILMRLITGASWETTEFLLGHMVSDTTLRTRRNEWVAAGVFENLKAEAEAAYDRIIGLDLDDVALDGSSHKAPCGGEGTGHNPFDRNRIGWKWSMAVDANGIPISYVTDGANTNDYKLLQPTLDALVDNGLIADINTLHLDRGYGYKSTPALIASYGITNLDVCMRRKPHQGAVAYIGLKKRWIVEAANSWLANYGQLRRNTDRRTQHRHAALCLAITFLITNRLIDHRNRHWRDHQGQPFR